MLQPGDTIDGRYTVDRLLARGGMATVYVVQHDKLGSLHALKVLDIDTPDIQQRLLQEGRVQASLGHPNIVAVTDTLEVEGRPALVMEYVDGPSLAQWIAENPTPLARAERWFQQIASAVGYAHDRGLVHRDLKPDNVLLSPMSGDLLPKVADFGIAKVLEESGLQGGMAKTRTGVAMGTPAYMPPEQIESKDVDHRADIFALGCILYELVCGKKAFPADTLLGVLKATAEGDYEPPERVVPGLPDRFVRAIHGALEPDPDRRIGSCAELMDVVRGGPPAPSTRPRRGRRQGRRWLLVLLLLAFVAVALLFVLAVGGGGAVWYATRTPAAVSFEVATEPPGEPVPVPVPAPVPAEAAPAPIPAVPDGQRVHDYVVAVNGVRRVARTADGVMKHAAAEGNVLVMVDASVTYVGPETHSPFFPYDLVAPDGTEYDPVLKCEMSNPKAYETSGVFTSGESRSGELCFEVPADLSGWRFRFKPEMTAPSAVLIPL